MRMLNGTVIELIADLHFKEATKLFAEFPFHPPHTPLEDLIARAYQALVARGYTYHSIYEKCRHWRHFMDYATTRDIGIFSPEFADEYLTSRQQQIGMPRSFLHSAKHALGILQEFQQMGQLRRFPLRRQDSPHHLFESPQTPLETVIARAYQAMIDKGYGYGSLMEASRLCRHLLHYAEAQGIDTLSSALVDAYLAMCREIPNVPLNHLNEASRVLRRLLEFQEYGSWRRFPLRSQEVTLASPVFKAARERFMLYWKTERQVSRNTYIYGQRYTLQFLRFLEDQGVQEWPQLSTPLIAQFVTENPAWSAGSRQVVVSTLRVFFQHLFVTGEVDRDWSACLPTFHRGQRRKLPSIWTEEELSALLSAVERTSAVGKRDYAILLLACRLGMRVSDIRTLRLDDIRWEDARLEFAQEKTGTQIILPLPEEVGEALIEYLRAGRPVTQHRQVFLCHTAPHGPLGDDNKLHNMLGRYRQRAGISCKPGRAYGMHSLRHTFATRLQGATVPLEIIAGLLGHQSLESTRIYTQIDVSALRQVALDPEEVQYVR